jgi:hypothetical protein
MGTEAAMMQLAKRVRVSAVRNSSFMNHSFDAV